MELKLSLKDERSRPEKRGMFHVGRPRAQGVRLEKQLESVVLRRPQDDRDKVELRVLCSVLINVNKSQIIRGLLGP